MAFFAGCQVKMFVIAYPAMPFEQEQFVLDTRLPGKQSPMVQQESEYK
jgi:hypothetical protein